MPEPANSYQLARTGGSEFTGTLRDAADYGTNLAADLGWGDDWQLEEPFGRQVATTPSATEPWYVLLSRTSRIVG